MQYRARDSTAVSAWIADKRGAYTHGGETVCPGFHLYRGFVGCRAWAAGKPCDYCFYKQTFWADPGLRKGVAWGLGLLPCEGCDPGAKWCDRGCEGAFLAPARAAVMKWLAHHKSVPRVLTAGELADSLGFSPQENPHVGMLLDLFSSPETNPHGDKLLLVTKQGLDGTNLHLEERQPSENVILSFSVGNMGAESEPFWLPAFFPGSRLVAAIRMLEAGWRVRLRLDPLGPGHDWQADVQQYSHTMAAHFWASLKPELVTLGTPRHRGGRVKLPVGDRAAIYHQAIGGLRDGGYEGAVGLCKETPGMIGDVLGIEPEEMRCNCMV